MRCAVLLAGAGCLALPAAAWAQQPGRLLHQFDGTDGSSPENALLRDASGALYGTGTYGGTQDVGTVFKLIPPAPGQTAWLRQVLHDFASAGSLLRDGVYPDGTLIADAQGDLFGTTVEGGGFSGGAVFELIPPEAGRYRWTETIIDNATSYPSGGVIMDSHGVLYGVQEGGDGQIGYAFKLVPPAAGQTGWTEQNLHSFSGGSDGETPVGGVAVDPAGNLYGVAEGGGTTGDGIVYELSPPARGTRSWTETILHTFTGPPSDGLLPLARLAIDAAGVLYGTTFLGGSSGDNGVAFSLTPPATQGGVWSYAVIFEYDGQHGSGSLAGFALGRAGTLLATSPAGGTFGRGLVYQLTPDAGQTTYTETDLYSFTGGFDGFLPYSTLTADPAGNWYGTASAGGKGCQAGCGTVFELFH